MVAEAVAHVVVFMQENHTIDNYFRSMRTWGVNIASAWPVSPNLPIVQQDQFRHVAHTGA